MPQIGKIDGQPQKFVACLLVQANTRELIEHAVRACRRPSSCHPQKGTSSTNLELCARINVFNASMFIDHEKLIPATKLVHCNNNSMRSYTLTSIVLCICGIPHGFYSHSTTILCIENRRSGDDGLWVALCSSHDVYAYFRFGNYFKPNPFYYYYCTELIERGREEKKTYYIAIYMDCPCTRLRYFLALNVAAFILA